VGVSVDPETVHGPEVTEKVSLALLCPPEVVRESVWLKMPEVDVIVSDVGVPRLNVKVSEVLLTSR
jgi:hypothetical protein